MYSLEKLDKYVDNALKKNYEVENRDTLYDYKLFGTFVTNIRARMGVGSKVPFKDMMESILRVRSNGEEIVKNMFPLHSMENNNEKKELLNKHLELAHEIRYNGATIIDILNVGDIKKTTYILRQLVSEGIIARGVIENLNEIRAALDSQDINGEELTLFINVNEKEKEIIKDVLKEHNLKVNNLTYFEGYKYALNKGLISANRKTR